MKRAGPLVADEKLAARVACLQMAMQLRAVYPAHSLAAIADELWEWAERDASAKKLELIGERKPQPIT